MRKSIFITGASILVASAFLLAGCGNTSDNSNNGVNGGVDITVPSSSPTPTNTMVEVGGPNDNLSNVPINTDGGAIIKPDANGNFILPDGTQVTDCAGGTVYIVLDSDGSHHCMMD